MDVWAVYVSEPNPPPGEKEPLEWMLLSSLPAISWEQALMLIGYYRCRWVIEQWHRCLKEGCRIEDSQLDKASDVMRLCAIMSVLAVRLLQIRDLADATSRAQKTSAADPSAPVPDGLMKLSDLVPPIYQLIVARLARVEPGQLTPALFLLTIAKRGGYLNRKHDARPGWIVLWRGWTEIVQMAYGIELYKTSLES